MNKELISVIFRPVESDEDRFQSHVWRAEQAGNAHKLVRFFFGSLFRITTRYRVTVLCHFPL